MKMQFVTSSMTILTMCLFGSRQKLAGEAAVPYGIIGCCEINTHSIDKDWPLFSPKSSLQCHESTK